MRRALPSRPRGIALLVALLTVALAAILIAGLLDRGELAYARTRNALRGEQAEAYDRGLEAYAAQVLAKDLVDDPDIDANTDIWAQPMPPQEVPGGFIAGSARDLNGCVNLNNLSSEAGQATAGSKALFANLLKVLGLDPAIEQAVIDWLGQGESPDTIDAYYLSMPVPYRSAQRRFAHVSELRLVRGITSDSYARIAPYVCALPPGTRLNVNTASVPVLQSLAPNLTQAQAESLWQNGTAHSSRQDFLGRLPQLNIAIDPAVSTIVDSKSLYFLVRGDVTLDGVPFTFFSLIERGRGIHVIGRSRGADDALASAALGQ